MKAKTIKSVIQKKIEAIASSVDDAEIAEIFRNKTVVTGGCIASMLLGEPVNDYDVYFKDYESTLKVAEYYVTKFNKARGEIKVGENVSHYMPTVVDEGDRIKIMIQSAGVASETTEDEYKYFESESNETTDRYIQQTMAAIRNGDTPDELDNAGKPAYRPVFLTDNAITLSNNVQLVIRFFGEPNKIHESYDFVHAMNYYTSWDKNLQLNPLALECLLTKELRYNGSLYPLCSIIRTRKFINRGWSITAGQYLKMVMQLNEMDLCDINTLREQCMGVDIAYFHEIMEYLQKQQNDGKDSIDSTYLMGIIDRLV